jgi:Repeat of unknown function (DUF5648)
MTAALLSVRDSNCRRGEREPGCRRQHLADNGKDLLQIGPSRLFLVCPGIVLPSPFRFSIPQLAGGDEEGHFPSSQRHLLADFFRSVLGHFPLTTSTAERDQVLATLPSYHFEGVGFEAYNAPGDGTLTLERFFNTQSHLHHYAASAAEIASILNGGAGPGWVDEGAGFIVHA